MTDRRRRKSLSMFRAGSGISGFTPMTEQSPVETQAPSISSRRRRPSSFFNSGLSLSTSTSSNISNADGPNSPASDYPESPKSRPKILQKAGSRTSTVFSSRRSMHSVDEGEVLKPTTSNTPSINEEEVDAAGEHGIFGASVLRHGEMQTTGGFFKKKSQYLVLTETHIVRFKSQRAASEWFPTIPASLGRSNTFRHSSMASISSLQELQASSNGSIDNLSAIPLRDVVAIYKLDDGRPYFSIELSYMDRAARASTLSLQLNDPRESETWLSCVRRAVSNIKTAILNPLPQRFVDYAARAIENENDYEPEHFHIFKAVQRASGKNASRSSSDDLSKLSSNCCFLVIGIHKIHLVPLPKQNTRSSSTSLSDLDSYMSFGITTLSSIWMSGSDDGLQLSFR